MKKILYIDPMSWNNLGIYDKNLLENIKCLKKIFYCNIDFPYESIENTEIIKGYKYQHKKNFFLKIFSYLYSQYKLYSYIKKKKIDIVHFQWLKIPFIDICLIKWLKSQNIHCILTAHNILPHDTGEKYYYFYKIIYENISQIIVHSDNTKIELSKKFNILEEKINVIPHGLLENEKNNGKNLELKIREADEIIFTLLGSLNNYKGIDILLKAWNQTNLKFNNRIKLIIAGKGEIKDIIPKNCNNVLIINKFLEDSELENIISETDVAVLPYRNISQSGVLLSFLAKKKPVLVSNVGGLIEPFKLGKVGWILEELNEDDLNKLIFNISLHKEEILNIKKNKELWDRIDNFYSWKKIGKLTEKLYIKIS